MSVKRYSVSSNIYEGLRPGAFMVVVPASDYDALAARLAEAQRQRDTLRKYTRHTWDCGAWLTAAVGTPCDCGLDAAIARAASGATDLRSEHQDKT